ncbi:MAG: acyl-CoA dehydrogenase, partial [Actinobacteria bacterium]|nr:acyl-CoA dehydrogenase [Actinomycetota bacterium]
TATADRLVALWREHADPSDTELRDAVTQAWIDTEAYRLQTLGVVTTLSKGGHAGPEASMVKIFWSELDVRLHELAMRILGPRAEVADSSWAKGWQFSLSGPIYAGTNEIQRNVVAERVLGLPRK